MTPDSIHFLFVFEFYHVFMIVRNEINLKLKSFTVIRMSTSWSNQILVGAKTVPSLPITPWIMISKYRIEWYGNTIAVLQWWYPFIFRRQPFLDESVSWWGHCYDLCKEWREYFISLFMIDWVLEDLYHLSILNSKGYLTIYDIHYVLEFSFFEFLEAWVSLLYWYQSLPSQC